MGYIDADKTNDEIPIIQGTEFMIEFLSDFYQDKSNVNISAIEALKISNLQLKGVSEDAIKNKVETLRKDSLNFLKTLQECNKK